MSTLYSASYQNALRRPFRQTGSNLQSAANLNERIVANALNEVG
jgi:hypothetical protein